MEGQKALGFHQNYLKGGVSDFWKPVLIFEITKTNTLLTQKGLAPILIAPPHTYIAYATQATISSVKQSKTNGTLCLHRTRSARQNTIEVIIISDAVYTGCCAVRQIPNRKLLPRSIYDMLTNDFQWSLYRCCDASSVDTVLLTYREEPKQPRRLIAGLPLLELSSCLIVPQTFSSFVFLSAISIFLSLGSAVH